MWIKILALGGFLTCVSVAHANPIAELTGEAARKRTQEARNRTKEVRGRIAATQAQIAQKKEEIGQIHADMERRHQAHLDHKAEFSEKVTDAKTKVEQGLMDVGTLEQALVSQESLVNHLISVFTEIHSKIEAVQETKQALEELAKFLLAKKLNMVRLVTNYSAWMGGLDGDERRVANQLVVSSFGGLYANKRLAQALSREIENFEIEGAQSNSEKILNLLVHMRSLVQEQRSIVTAQREILAETIKVYSTVDAVLN